jgi:hypothetical protein
MDLHVGNTYHQARRAHCMCMRTKLESRRSNQLPVRCMYTASNVNALELKRIQLKLLHCQCPLHSASRHSPNTHMNCTRPRLRTFTHRHVRVPKDKCVAGCEMNRLTIKAFVSACAQVFRVAVVCHSCARLRHAFVHFIRMHSQTILHNITTTGIASCMHPHMQTH